MTTPPLTGSVAEQTLAVQLAQAGIPFEREAKFYANRRWRADFLLPRNIIIEVEGGAWVGGRHVTGSGFARDMEKYNKAAELGYTVLRYTPAMIEDGSAIEQIRRIVAEGRAA
jgi:very-short-patch-repair endonuclease